MNFEYYKRTLDRDLDGVLEPTTQVIGDSIAEKMDGHIPHLDSKVGDSPEIKEEFRRCKDGADSKRELASCTVKETLEWANNVGELPPREEVMDRLEDRYGYVDAAEQVSDVIDVAEEQLDREMKVQEAGKVLA